MAISAFDDKAKPPTEAELAATLGPAYPLWSELLTVAGKDGLPLAPVWGFTAKSTGWSVRLKSGERTIVYLAPSRGYFLASFALGQKAVAAALASKISSSVKTIIENGKQYAEGRAVRLEVKNARILGAVKKLIEFKMAN